MKVYFHTPILLLSVLFCFGATNPGNCFASDIQQPGTDTKEEIIMEIRKRKSMPLQMPSTASYERFIYARK